MDPIDHPLLPHLGFIAIKDVEAVAIEGITEEMTATGASLRYHPLLPHPGFIAIKDVGAVAIKEITEEIMATGVAFIDRPRLPHPALIVIKNVEAAATEGITKGMTATGAAIEALIVHDTTTTDVAVEAFHELLLNGRKTDA